MSLLLAKDKNGVSIHVNNADHSCTYYCPFCGIRIFKKMSSRGNPFYSCYADEKHTSIFCKHISKAKVTHDSKNTDPDQFFFKLFNNDPPNPSLGTSPSHHNSSVTVIDPEAGVERPFTALKQIWAEGLSEIMKPESLFGGIPASEFIIFRKWYPLCFQESRFHGGNRIIQSRPEQIFRNKTIKFVCFWRALEKWKRVYLLLEYQDKQLFFDHTKLFFTKKFHENGTSVQEPNDISVLVAGHWEIVPTKPNYDQTFKCVLSNDRQVYICPPK